MATVVRDSNDAITVQDLNGNITAWNKKAQLMYGWSEAEALEMNIRDIIPENKINKTKTIQTQSENCKIFIDIMTTYGTNRNYGLGLEM